MCKLCNLAVAATLALTACSNTDSTPVPRKYAYPRINISEAAYSQADSVPVVDFAVNTAEARLLVNPKGCDIVYDRYGATVYVSVISNLDTPEKFNDAWDNRVERINRNLGGTQKNTVEVKNKNFTGVVIIAPTVSQTPIQLLSANTDDGVIVSATAFMHNNIPTNAYDSIAPIYQAISHDITNLAKTLKCK